MIEDFPSKTQGFEVKKRFLENKNEQAVIECLNELESNKKSIGYGHNAEVFIAEGVEVLKEFCVKKMLKLPKVKINSVEAEFDFQEEVNNLGIKTPRNVMMVKNKTTTEEYIIMERVNGHSIGDILDPHNREAILSEGYVHEDFFKKLQAMVKKMHDNRIYHRDLHKGNVMINENGEPVIIDFGAATHGYGDDDDIYRAYGGLLVDKENSRYDYGSSLLPDDDLMVKNLELIMRVYKK